MDVFLCIGKDISPDVMAGFRCYLYCQCYSINDLILFLQPSHDILHAFYIVSNLDTLN